MAKKYRNLIDEITSDANMRRAFRLTSRGKRLTAGYLQFKEWSEFNLDSLAREIATGEYRPHPTRSFVVYEPKPRAITAASFRDRVAHHALCAVIGPIFDATLLPRTYACRDGLGTHAGVVALQSDMRRIPGRVYALKTDFSKYFASIDRRILNQIIRRKISCEASLALIETITPPDGVGIPIGALTSQLYANIYGGVIDRYLQCDLKEKNWYRYMDDIVVLGDSIERLHFVRGKIERLAEEELGLRFSKWNIQPVARGVNYLGYRIWPTHKLLRKSSVIRAKRAVRSMRERGDMEALDKFLAAWTGHALWADTHNLFSSLGLEIS